MDALTKAFVGVECVLHMAAAGVLDYDGRSLPTVGFSTVVDSVYGSWSISPKVVVYGGEL